MLPWPHVLCYDKHGFIPWSQSTRLSREGALGPLSFISERQYIEQSTDNQQDQSAVNRTELQHYYISFRIIKFLLPNGSAEYIYTNLPKEDFTLDEVRGLYNRRWGIETSFRDIKYAAGMLFFHSRKKQLLLQEIYAKLILYNFSEAVTGGIVIQKRKGNMQYSINFTIAVSLCVEFIRRSSNGADLFELDDLISRHLVPVRPGRSSPRYIRARTATSFLYR